MTKVAIAFEAGNYRFVRAVMQYSAGVVAQSGFVVQRARFARSLPLADGFAAIEAFLDARGRPLTAFCACELRSPEPFTEQGFAAFNREYVKTLEQWNIYRDGVNPVARTNVCPLLDPPSSPSLYAFSYTVPSTSHDRATFVVAGSGETREGGASYRENIVALGDISLAGLRAKVRHVVEQMDRRMSLLGVTHGDITTTNAYTVHDIGPLVRTEILERKLARDGLVLHACRPPVVDLEFEMDVLGTAAETFIQ
ncbi:MAG TPA: hypothetical protein VNE58_17190 [Casimicrobiaceae bacterium]|nr:hypothetical protein [Casimicrobiaceae bacterium]